MSLKTFEGDMESEAGVWGVQELKGGKTSVDSFDGSSRVKRNCPERLVPCPRPDLGPSRPPPACRGYGIRRRVVMKNARSGNDLAAGMKPSIIRSQGRP
ncbi:hypothetical protein BD311DRAFT_771686 [Dichomitus squalens]|uniref:Uncharacterized protein n=1 Tax=Dichomitus squalens TaxID=114155 RepID=A0A4Q9M7V4_9APHY|nr:hypothetical protein BD311DRAFT_771686 [Dichomitus squalens]